MTDDILDDQSLKCGYSEPLMLALVSSTLVDTMLGRNFRIFIGMIGFSSSRVLPR